MSKADIELIWRPVRDPDDRFADWVHNLSDRAYPYEYDDSEPDDEVPF